jgi:hypothetical protein
MLVKENHLVNNDFSESKDIHIFLEFNSKVNMKDPAHLDLFDENSGRNYHPNIQQVKNKADVINYLLKDVNLHTSGSDLLLMSPVLASFV